MTINVKKSLRDLKRNILNQVEDSTTQNYNTYFFYKRLELDLFSSKDIEWETLLILQDENGSWGNDLFDTLEIIELLKKEKKIT